MKKQPSLNDNKPETIKTDPGFPSFPVMVTILIITIGLSLLFISRYKPKSAAPQPQITLEQKMEYFQTGESLPQQNTQQDIPRWMMILILGFIIFQILPLLLASYKARASDFTKRDIRQIEFLTETPLFLGLLGSLLGVCMTQFLSGTLSAPLAYLTTISGILLYLFGRFTILVSLPTSAETP